MNESNECCAAAKKYAGIGEGRIPYELLRRPHQDYWLCAIRSFDRVNTLYARYEV